MTSTLPTTDLVLRDGTPDDYPRLAQLLSATWPDTVTTTESLQEEDRTRDARCRHGLLVAEHDGRLVGAAQYDQFAGMYHPRKFFTWVRVHPEFEGRGLGRRLADELDARLAAFDPLSLLAYTREDHVRGVRFVQARGFSEKMRYFESRLDVPAFDPAPYAGVIAAVEADGIALRSLAELPDTREHRERLYDLFAQVRRDVPRPDEATDVSFEQFEQWTWGSAYYLPEGFFVAVDTATGQYAGLSALWRSDGAYLQTGLTGVRREYRRRRIALALKLRAIAYARSVGAPEIRTGNETNNRPMLAINEALGFVKQPAWIDFVRTVGQE